MKKIAFVILSVVFSLGVYAQADNVLGVWYNQEKTGKIEITREGNKYVGKVIWLKVPLTEDGKPVLDVKNPDEKLRSRPKMGLQVMKNFVYNAKDNKWENGTIYDTVSGKTYSCVMWFEGNQINTLNVRGYVGITLIGRSQVWTRTSK